MVLNRHRVVGGDFGPVGHVDQQAPPDRPVTSFVTPASVLGAHATAGGCHWLHGGGRTWR